MEPRANNTCVHSICKHLIMLQTKYIQNTLIDTLTEKRDLEIAKIISQTRTPIYLIKMLKDIKS